MQYERILHRGGTESHPVVLTATRQITIKQSISYAYARYPDVGMEIAVDDTIKRTPRQSLIHVRDPRLDSNDDCGYVYWTYDDQIIQLA